MKGWAVILCCAWIGCAQASAESQDSLSAMGGAAGAVLHQVDALAARALALEERRELVAAAVDGLVEACGVLGIARLTVRAGEVTGECARPTIASQALTSKRPLGARLETAAARTFNHRPGAAGDHVAAGPASPRAP